MQSRSQDVPIDADANRDLLDLWSMVWEGRWLVISLCVALGLLGSIYATLAPKWYRAEVLLVQTNDRVESSLISQFGGFASLAGINLGSRDDVEPLAVLKSRGFAQNFIEDHGLTTVLLADKWDAANSQWRGSKRNWPDIRDAVTYFDKKVRRVIQDRKTGLVTLAVEWKNPDIAAQWANRMASKLNDQMRNRAIVESTENVRYLRAEIAANNLVALQQPMSKLLELELQKLMLARNNKQFSFRVVDTARAPKKSIRPQLVPSVALGTVLGALLSVVILFARKVPRTGRTHGNTS